MTQSDPQQPHDDEARFAAFMRRIPEFIAADANPPGPPKPWVDKPAALAAAEADLFRCELVLRIRRVLCGDVGRCKDGRCRRTKRCRQLDALRPLVEAARAAVAKQQAKWQPPSGKPARKKGRTGVRP